LSGLGFGELVNVGMQGSAGFPTEFTWRRRRYAVRSVRSFWPRSGGRRPSPAARSLYEVLTESGMRCVLSRELARDLWRLERVLS